MTFIRSASAMFGAEALENASKGSSWVILLFELGPRGGAVLDRRFDLASRSPHILGFDHAPPTMMIYDPLVRRAPAVVRCDPARDRAIGILIGRCHLPY